MKDRIKQIMDLKHMTQQSFAEYIEMSPASLSSIFNGRTRPTLNIVEAIKKKFPDISTDWLMFGTGEMLKAGEKPLEEDAGQGSSAEKQPFDFSLSSSSVLSALSEEESKVQKNKSVRDTHPEIVREEIKYIDSPQRKITEIRVYFDDLTFESFVPAK